ncbi:MAG: hypothetical protein ACTSXA_04960 [Candidatus Heimdallarchaeota archaeon]
MQEGESLVPCGIEQRSCDVFFPSHFPIWELPNVIATPHNVGFNERTAFSNNSLKIIAENINRLVEGKEPINQVDKKHQY